MDELETGPAKAVRKHLHTARTMSPPDGAPDRDLTRRRGQGNGVRVHGIYFAAVSLIALVLVIVAVALASTMR